MVEKLQNLNSLKMNEYLTHELASAYQSDLIFCSLEGLSPADCLGKLFGGQFGVQRKEWQKCVVEFIFLNMSVGFFELGKFGGVDVNTSPAQVRDFLMNSESTETADLWLVLQLFGTEKLSLILEKYNLLSWASFKSKPLPAFIEEISSIYKEFDKTR